MKCMLMKCRTSLTTSRAANAASLMREIDEAIAREELGVFRVDVDEPESENEEDQEGPHDTKKEETKINSKSKDTEGNLEK